MKEMMKNNLEVFEEKNIKNSIVYIKNAKINLESYESKILSENNIDGLIRFEVTYEGENRTLKYEVNNSISLEEYLKTEKISKKVLCEIVIAIDEVLSSLENYLISENSIILDPRLVRIICKSNKSLEFKFIAIPNLNSDFSYELSKFLVRVLRYVDIDDKEALSLAYSLFVKSSKDNYTMNDLIETIDMYYNKDYIDDTFEENLISYDEEMAKEVSEELLKSEYDVADIEYEDEVNSAYNKNDSDNMPSEGIIMDDETKEIISESLFNDFNKEDKKIIRFRKRGLRSRKSLKGHIKLSLMIYIVAPIFLIAVPFIYYILNGREKFIRAMPILIVYIALILIVLVLTGIIGMGEKQNV